MDAIQIALWIIGSVLLVLVAVIGFLANWHHKTADRVREVEKSISDFRAHVSENYAGHIDTRRLEDKMDAVANEMRDGLKDVAAKLNQLIGQTNRG